MHRESRTRRFGASSQPIAGGATVSGNRRIAEGYTVSGPLFGYPRKVKDPEGIACVGGLLVCIIRTHIDDLKGSGAQKEREPLLWALERDYG